MPRKKIKKCLWCEDIIKRKKGKISKTGMNDYNWNLKKYCDNWCKQKYENDKRN